MDADAQNIEAEGTLEICSSKSMISSWIEKGQIQKEVCTDSSSVFWLGLYFQ